MRGLTALLAVVSRAFWHPQHQPSPEPAKPSPELIAIYPWATRDPQLFRDVVNKLDHALARWEELTSRLSATLDAPLGPSDQVRLAMLTVRNAFDELATVVSTTQPRVKELAAVATPPRARWRWWRHPPPSATAATKLRELLHQLAEADGRCRLAVEQAITQLPAPYRGSEQAWLPTLDTAELHHVAAQLDQRGHLHRARETRALLRTLTPAQLVTITARYPAVTTDLAMPTPTSELPPALRTVLASAEHEPTSLHRVHHIRQQLSEVAPGDWQRWAVLFPAVVGPLDGAPICARILANRMLVRAALVTTREDDRLLERALAADGRRFQGSLRGRLTGWLMATWHSHRSLASMWSLPLHGAALMREDLRARIRLYEALLHQRYLGRDQPLPRRLLKFDATGHGQAVELVGVLDERTTALAVLVPGTGSAARGFHMPAGFAHDAVASEASGLTAAIAWMGAEFPQTFAGQAPLTHFATNAGVPLRDHLAGLPIPDACRVTVIGHSYGGVIVGAAEKAGLQADRIVHAASAGAGPGVRSVADYPDTDPLGQPRSVRRFTLTAPGDPVRWAQRASSVANRAAVLGVGATGSGEDGSDTDNSHGDAEVTGGVSDGNDGVETSEPRDGVARPVAGQLRSADVEVAAGEPLWWLPALLRPHAQRAFAQVNLGVDPATLEGITVLETGTWEVARGGHPVGEVLAGPPGHAAVTTGGTTAFRQIMDVVTGQR